MKRAAAVLLFVGSIAVADGIDDRLRSAQALLESDDAGSREKGEAELAAIGAEAGSRLKRLLEHPDPEVRTRVNNVLDREQIIPEDGKTARLRELFKELEAPGRADEARRKVVRDILELDPRAVAIVARELKDGQLTPVAPAAAVQTPGRVTAEFTAENHGACGAWLRPDRWYVFANLKPFGERPGHGSMSAGAMGAVINLRGREATNEDAMVAALASMVRVSKDGKIRLASSASDRPRCGTLWMKVQAIGYSPAALEATFSGVAVALPENGMPGCGTARPLVGEIEGKQFAAKPFFDDDGSRGLQVTALHDVAGSKPSEFDAFWWVALDAKGVFLAEGAFCTDEADLAAWTKGDVRRVKLRGGLPGGTKTLWMGITLGGDECVPAAVEIK